MMLITLFTSHRSKYAAAMRVALSLLSKSLKPGIISHSAATQCAQDNSQKLWMDVDLTFRIDMGWDKSITF